MGMEQKQTGFETATVAKEDTGLPYDILIDSIGRCSENTTPRIWVKADDEPIPVLLSENPNMTEYVKKDGIVDIPHFAEIEEYIALFYNVFMAHFNKELTDKEALNLLTKPPKPTVTHEFDALIDAITIKPLDIVQTTRKRYIGIGRLRIPFGYRHPKLLILSLPDKSKIFDDSDLVFYAVDLDCDEPENYGYWHDHPFITEVEKIDKKQLSKKQSRNLEKLLEYLPTDEWFAKIFNTAKAGVND